MTSRVADYTFRTDVGPVFEVYKTGKLLSMALMDAVVIKVTPVDRLISDTVGYEKAGGREIVVLHDRNSLRYV
jgi:hypothetical protein